MGNFANLARGASIVNTFNGLNTSRYLSSTTVLQRYSFCDRVTK